MNRMVRLSVCVAVAGLLAAGLSWAADEPSATKPARQRASKPVTAQASEPASKPSPDPTLTAGAKLTVTPPGEPVLELPTLQSLGAYWIIAGDEKKEWRVDMTYRLTGQQEWRKSMPMFRVRKGDTTQGSHNAELNPPSDAWLFAGSIVNLTPGTDYELKLTLVKPGQAPVEKVLKARTNSEPVDPEQPRICHVAPGDGGGDGSAEKPYLGLDFAQGQARPGTIFLMHSGTYRGQFHIVQSGEPGKPIIWRGAGDGEAVIDGGGVMKNGIEFARVHDVRVEKLSIKGVYMGMAIWDSSNIAVRRCHIYDVKCGIYGASSDGVTKLQNIFIADNTLDGPFNWANKSLGAGTEEWRGIQITGTQYDVCYNRIRNFKDGIDTFPSKYCSAIDFHHNEVSGSKDDGCEMDFSERNTRCFMNRFVNVHQGISEQPIFGGPVYIFRNAIYNIQGEPFKLHHVGGKKGNVDFAPSGAILYHNTIVKITDPFPVHSPATFYNCVTRNNLFIGGGKRAMDFDAPAVDCDFDYDAFGGGPWDLFLKWNGGFYKTFEEAKAKAPVEKHAVVVDPAKVFASGVERPTELLTEYPSEKIDLRPGKDSPVVGVGEVLPGFNDGFAGKAPAIGAYEPGGELPHYGPRPEK